MSVQDWWHFPIEMPLDANGDGPATVGVDAVKITYEVWDRLLVTHGSFDNLPDAIDAAMLMNETMAQDMLRYMTEPPSPSPSSDTCAGTV
jgi:hypothetical protein